MTSSRCVRASRTGLITAVLLGTSMAWPSIGVSQQTQPDRRPAAAPTVPAANTSVIERPGSPQAKRTELVLSALLTAAGPAIDQGLVWRVYQAPADAGVSDATPPKLLETRRDAAPSIPLPPGDYVVNVAFGRANITRRLTLPAGTSLTEKFVLDAGGLRIKAALASGEPMPDASVTYDVYATEADQLGNRAKIVSGARPGLIMRLNAGPYQIVSVWGDANAIVRADVTVEAGKLLEATVTHHGAKITFKLVERAGGEAVADTQWMVHTPQGETVVESSGALPTHILAAGTYIVSARHAGRTFRSEFVLDPGDPVQVEVVMK
jgi:hypothetical protein